MKTLKASRFFPGPQGSFSKILDLRWVHLRIPVLLLMLALLLVGNASGQSFVEFSTGTSFKDRFDAQIALRKQLTPKFRAGLELQYGSPQYRFVGAKPIREGYSYSFSLPLSFRLAEEEQMQLYGVGRVGARFQGIIDPDENDMRDSILASTALITEFGLLTSFKLKDKINLQSGMTFPIAYELSPESLQEFLWIKLHLGGSVTRNRSTFFLHTNAGHAFGASGDTYKFIWSAKLGIRYAFGETENSTDSFIDPSF